MFAICEMYTAVYAELYFLFCLRNGPRHIVPVFLSYGGGRLNWAINYETRTSQHLLRKTTSRYPLKGYLSWKTVNRSPLSPLKFTSGPGWPGRSPIAKESHLPSSTKKHQDNQKSCDSIVARAFSDLLVICLVCTGGYSRVEPAFHLYLRTTRKFQEMKSEERRNNVFFNKQLATCPPQQQTPTQEGNTSFGLLLHPKNHNERW